MCLQSIIEDHEEPDSGIGYKVVTRKFRWLPFAWLAEYWPDRRGHFQWIRSQASNVTIYPERGQDYPSGFHVFKSLDDAKSWKGSSNMIKLSSRPTYTIIKVRYKGLRALGRQSDGELVLVTKYITPLGEVK